jgi:hypothetical protein
LALAISRAAPSSRYRWLVRLALVLFALATIGGWLMFGGRYFLGYLARRSRSA